MFAFLRAGALAAVFALATGVGILAANAADKPFQRQDLSDGAVKLEAQIKADAGPVTKPVSTLKREADSAFERRDFRGGMQVLSQIAAVAPTDAANWLRLAGAILKIQPANDADRTVLLERASTAAYIGYQRSRNPTEEAEGLVLIGRTFADRAVWRPALDALRLSLELRETADVRSLYERMRDEHGFRVLDNTVDSDAASPRVCFQFSEELAGKRTDFSPFVALAGQDRPALSTDDKQLCVEGLTHGQTYNVTLRAGLPSAVHETLTKSVEFNIYVRDRSPFVHFTGNAYVLPRLGQRGIPLVSVNTSTVAVEIYRIGDRNLIETVLGSDFKHNLYRFDVDHLKDARGFQVWKGELQVASTLNADVTTAFPVDTAVGKLDPGVYVMVAEPAGPASENALATQWFIVSDLGLATLSSADGITIFVHSLATTEGKAGISVRLLARNNEVLATHTTDQSGVTHFDAGLARGEGGLSPAMVVAESQGDYAFLDLKGPAFDLSDRGVSGRPAPDALDAFVYTERGVYRSGETVHITTLLRDAKGDAVAGVPVILVVERPDGVEYRREIVSDQGIGGRTLSVPIVGTAPTGTWRVHTFTDPKRPSLGDVSFMVEDYVPDRLEFDLKATSTGISKSTPATLAVDGRYLYGAPAAALTLDGEITLAASRERPGLPGYQFGLADEEVSTERQTLENLPDTDERGRAQFTVALDQVPITTRPLEAQIGISMSDPGGRAVERKVTLPVTPGSAMIGVKPLFSGSSLGQGSKATFDVVVVAPDGTTQPQKGLRWQLLRIENRYQWFRQNGEWEFQPVKSTARTAEGAVDTAADKPGHIEVPVTWGRYRLEVAAEDPSGPVTSVTFDAGWYADASQDTPDVLEVALDKPEYHEGDNMTVAVTAPAVGKVTLAVVGDRLITTTVADVQPGLARIPLTVGKEWGTGAYVVATFRRPLDIKASRMPGRAIGVRWFAIDRAAHTLALDLKLPDLLRPRETLHVPVRIGGLAPGERAQLVMAAVDVGILNLTNYKPPDPNDYYLGQRRLSAEIRDLYGQLIDGMQGTRGQIRTGGDAGGMELTGSPPTQPPLALYSGIVTVGPDGTTDVSFDIPAFSGTVRVMAIAWSKGRLGHASGDVTIRDPVVLTTTLPRFLLSGDRGTVHVDLDNVEGAAGDYVVQVTTDGPFGLADPSPRTLRLGAGKRGAFALAIAASGVGAGTLGVKITGPGAFAVARTYALAVKPANQVLARRTVKPIAPGESLTLSNDLFADLVPGTGSVALSIGPSTAFDVAGLLRALDRYPFGCSEQIASRAMPLLYVNELAAEAHLHLDAAIYDRIRDSIQRLLARQDSNGSFGLWSAGGEDAWLDAYVTDFLTRARERGFAVPDPAFKLALDRLRNQVAMAADPSKNDGNDLAYVLYVLARNRLAPLGDLRYLADAKLTDVKTPIARAQIAAALAMMGDHLRSDKVYAAALELLGRQSKPDLGRTDYGSALRDSAALVTLASEGGAPRPTVQQALERVEAARRLSAATSTQEEAWLVLAARALGRNGIKASLDVAGEPHQGSLYRTFDAVDLGNGVKITNLGDATLQAVVSVGGAPVVPEPATEKGFKIERRYYTADGEAADPTKANQNQRFVVVLRVTEGQPQFGRVMVVDHVPAGFEVDNPHLVSSGDTGTLSWIEDAAEPASSEFRDDRFSAAFDRKSDDRPVFAVAYVVRAVSPGHYVLPQAYVEDMYRPDRFGRTGTGSVDVVAAK